MNENYLYEMALSKLPGIGPRKAKLLIQEFGSAEEMFSLKMEDINSAIGQNFSLDSGLLKQCLDWAQTQIKWMDKNNIQSYFYQDPQYPPKLKKCGDGPILLYGKGQFKLNSTKVVAIVGTRDCTDYGKKIVEDLIKSIAGKGILVVSGLAYGIDIHVHKECIKQGVENIAVLGNSIDRVYPANHRGVAAKLVKCGGLLSEWTTGVKPDRENFPKRNRIVAGMSHATIVVESKIKGGSMITAELSNGYHNEVFAFPGSIYAEMSEGCNHLIQENKAISLQKPGDFLKFMEWDQSDGKQMQLFDALTQEEELLVNYLREGPKHIDIIKFQLKDNLKDLPLLMLQMEMKGLIIAKPGNIFQLI